MFTFIEEPRRHDLVRRVRPAVRRVGSADKRRRCRCGVARVVQCEALEQRRLLSASIIISEFLASNATGLPDADGDRSDWIELFNSGAVPANLDGWSLTDDPSTPDEWSFPAVSIPAEGRLVVFASDKDRRDPAQELHANSKLSADGEYLALAAPGGVPASEFNPFPPQPVDVSYGFVGSDYSVFRYLTKPTPGAANDASSVQYVGDTHFSVDRGSYDQPFQVAITTDSRGRLDPVYDGRQPPVSDTRYACR